MNLMEEDEFAPLVGSIAEDEFAPLVGSRADEEFAPLAGSMAGEELAPTVNLEETILASERVYRGRMLNLDEVQVKLPDGGISTREVVRHPGAVAIIAIDGRGNILLVRQFRTALERIVLEIPAGKLDINEDAEDCARRELEEETGYRAGALRYLAPVAVAAGYSDEILHIFMATELSPGEAHPDSNEFLTVEWMPIEDLVCDVLDGKVEDGKTIIAALLCDTIYRRLGQQATS
jgi:ADP-ribose pyrophosphatase